MTNSVDPDQLASEEANWSGSTLFAKTGQIRVQQDQGYYSTTYSIVFIGLVNGQQMLWLDFKNAQIDLGLHCLHMQYGPILSIVHHILKPLTAYLALSGWILPYFPNQSFLCQ